MYFEDEDLCKRLNDRNEKIVLVPDAVFHHQHSHTTDIDNSKKIDRQNAISARYLRIKYAKNKLASLYGITIDDMFDSLKQLLRGNVVYGVDKTIVGFKLFSLLLRKKTNNN
jgi:GT2 family glycosyltransferase